MNFSHGWSKEYADFQLKRSKIKVPGRQTNPQWWAGPISRHAVEILARDAQAKLALIVAQCLSIHLSATA